MQTNHLIKAALALLLFGSMALAQGDSWLTIEVREPAGHPVKDACVTLIPKQGEIVFRKADRQGQVKLRNVSAGDYRIVVKAEGYQAQKRVVVVKETGADTFAFTMQPREANNR